MFIDEVSSQGLVIFEQYMDSLNSSSITKEAKDRKEHELITIMTSKIIEEV